MRKSVVLIRCCLIAGAYGLPLIAFSQEQDLTDSPQQVELQFLPQSDEFPRGAVRATGIRASVLAELQRSNWSRAQWVAAFPVRMAVRGQSVGDTAMLGAYEVTSRGVQFIPRFPWQGGATYEAIFLTDRLPGRDAGSSLPAVRVAFAVSRKPPAKPTVVTHVFPSGQELPENLLKFYIHFSRPMSRGRSYERIALFHATGQRIVDPFLEIGEELWDGAGRRFTLFLDPGRVKRGLRPNLEEGPVFQAGESYVLRIDKNWLDATGNPLSADYEKRFRIVSADRDQPDVRKWQLHTPPAGATAPLEIQFSEPLDHAMLQRVVAIHRNDRRLDGKITIGAGERTWAFRPDQPWEVGEYRVLVASTLEDLAGNSLGRKFEVDLQNPQPRDEVPAVVERKFLIEAK